MDKKLLQKEIISVLEDVSRLQNALYALNMSDVQRYPENFEVLSTDVALRSEAITCKLRHLIYGATNIKKADYLNHASFAQEIEIKYEDGILQIKLPSLLPKRKQHQGTEFLIDPLYFTLDEHSKQNKLPMFSECVVCFSHVYNRELSKKRIRDYDNLELKQILDVVSTFTMKDDSAILSDTYNTLEFSNVDCTYIYVMEKSEFSSWLNLRK